MDPKKVLREARLYVKSRDYAAALEKYIWFHEHALETSRAWVGVRLSYAIMEWADLGKVYPPALKELERVRDSKTESLIAGVREPGLFHDVHAINRTLEQVERTRDLFKVIAHADQELAEKCFPFALDSLVEGKEFELARRFMPDVRTAVERYAQPFKFADRETASKEMFREALVTIYAKNVGMVLQVLIGVGEEAEAERVRQYAVDRVTDPELWDMVLERLYPSRPTKTIQ